MTDCLIARVLVFGYMERASKVGELVVVEVTKLDAADKVRSRYLLNPVTSLITPKGSSHRDRGRFITNIYHLLNMR